MRKLLGIALLALLLAAMGCKKEEYSRLYAFDVVVLDKQNESGLEGVLLTLNPGSQSKTTGADGRAGFERLTDERYVMMATKPGYHSVRRNLTGRIGERVTVHITMEKE